MLKKFLQRKSVIKEVDENGEVSLNTPSNFLSQFVQLVNPDEIQRE